MIAWQMFVLNGDILLYHGKTDEAKLPIPSVRGSDSSLLRNSFRPYEHSPDVPILESRPWSQTVNRRPIRNPMASISLYEGSILPRGMDASVERIS